MIYRMPFRRRNSLRPIKSIKHIIDSQGGTVADTKTPIDLVVGSATVSAGTNAVTIGSRVNAIFLNVQAYVLTGAGLNNFYMIIYKNPGNNIGAADIPKGNAVGADEFRRQVFHQEMVMLGALANQIPITVFKGVIMIPRVFRTIRENDKITIQLFTGPGVTSNFCVQAIYKSYE